jgi:hypothetical protein
VLSDAFYITRGLKDADTLPDTLQWWTGTWSAGADFAFFRPLTSTFWWLQYKLWGPNGLIGFLFVNAILHAAFVVILWLFLTELLGLAPATLAACFFVTGLGRLFAVAIPQYALMIWIDTPEMTCGISVVLALWCYLHYLRRGSARDLAATCVLFVIGICWKESAYTIPFFALLLLWYEKQWPRWKSLLPLGFIALTGIIYRTWALQGRGYHLGSNNSWKERYVTETMGGQVARMAVNSDSLALSLVCAVAAGLLLWQRKRRLALGFGLAALTFLIRFVRFTSDLDFPLLTIFLSPFWIKAAFAAACVFIAYRFLINRERGQLLGFGWIQCAYLPLLTAPLTAHALYFVAVGWAIWLAYTAMDLLPLCWDWLARRPALASLNLPAFEPQRSAETA